MNTPFKIEDVITPRDYKFDFSKTPKYWLNDSPYVEHIFNAASHALPLIEGLVNFSVRQVMQDIKDKGLHDDCVNFISQETFHAREHIKYNKMLLKHGFYLTNIVQALTNKLKKIRKNSSPLSLVAIAVGFECITSIMSETILQDDVLTHADETVKSFWNWHMKEEVEHKSVLMNLYQHLGGGYFRRVTMLTYVVMNYLYYGLRIYFKLLKNDKRSFFKGLRCISRRKFFFYKAFLKVFNCYRYNYHPEKKSSSYGLCASKGLLMLKDKDL